MREIKFRAWNKKQNIWVCPPSFDRTDGYTAKRIPKDNGGITLISQYTGLKDKNGKEIYEGDILRHYFSCSQCNQKYIDAIVERQRDGRYLRNITKGEHGIYDIAGMIYDWEEREIIGDIYENPDLIPNQK